MAISKDDIIQAAEALERDSEKATMASVREFLGGGSFATISPVLREWKESRKTTTAVALEMPGELKTVAERMETEFWQTASQLANEKLITVQTDAEATVSAAESERDEVLQDIVRLEKELLEAAEGRQKAEEEKNAAHEQINSLKADQIRLQEQLTASKTEAGQLREDLRRMTSEKARQAEESSRLLGVNGELKREVETSKKQSLEADQRFQGEVVKVTNLENNLQHLTGEKEVLTKTSNSQASELIELKTTVSGLETKMDDRNTKIERLEKENGKLQEVQKEAITFKAELDTSKTRIRELAQESGELKQENKVLHKQSGGVKLKVFILVNFAHRISI